MSEGNASFEMSTSGEFLNLLTKKDWFLGWVNRLDKAGQDLTLDVAIVPTVPLVVLYVCVAIIVVPGIAGNVLLFLLSRSPDLSVHPYSLYLSTISISDSVALVVMYADMFLQAIDFMLASTFSNLHWCRVVHTLYRALISLSPWSLVGFSLDRYVALVFPLKRKAFCTFWNAKMMIGSVLVLSLTTQALVSMYIDLMAFQGNVVCAFVTKGALIVSQIEFCVNMLIPVFAMLFLNTHSLIAVKIGIAERMHLNRSAAGESAGVSPRGQSTERHGEATGGEEGAHALDRETTGGQADRGEAATSGTEREPQDVEQGSLSQPGREQGLKADGSKDRARGPTSRGNGEDVGRGRNPGRRREDPANSQSEIRRMSRALLSIPFFSFLCMVPYAFVITIGYFSLGVETKICAWLDRRLFLALNTLTAFYNENFLDTNLGKTQSRDIVFALETVEPYLRVLFTLGYAANFYLLVGTSKRYRDIAWKVVRQRCGRRQD